VAEVADREAVAQAHATRAGDALKGVAKRGEVGDVQATRVDARRAAGDDHDACGDSEDDRHELGATLGRLLLGVVEGPKRPNFGAA
jgi:hypothetical protein